MFIYYFIIFYWILLFFGTQKYTINTFPGYYNLNGDSEENRRKLVCIFAIIPLFLVMGLKSPYVGSDTLRYISRYENAYGMLNFSSYYSELGYNYLGYFCNNILELNWQVYLILVSLFICYSLGNFILYFSDSILWSVFLHFTIGLFTMSMSGLRQTIAIFICYIALVAIFTVKGRLKRNLITILCVALAYSIHNSAFCFIPVLFIAGVSMSKSKAILLQILATIGIIFRNQLISIGMLFVPTRYSGYETNADYSINILVLLLTIVIPVSCLLVARVNKNGLFSPEISLMYIFSACNILFTGLSMNNNQIGRLAYYFVPSYLIIIPHAFRYLREKDKLVISGIVIVLCIIYFTLGTSGGTLKLDNYSFFWE